MLLLRASNFKSRVVAAKRRSRQGETLVKRIISHAGYTVINKLSDVPLPRNTGDFRIVTRRVMEELRRLNESHGFLRGLVAYDYARAHLTKESYDECGWPLPLNVFWENR